MTPDLTNAETRIDNDKKRREREIELFLLALLLLSRRYATAAVRLGSDPYAALAAVLLGSQALSLPGGTVRLAALMALADADGFRRTTLFVPGQRFTYTPTTDYRSLAAQALAAMLATLQRRVGQAFVTAKRDVGGLVVAVQDVFRTGGYVESGPAGAWRVRGATEGLVAQAYGAGLWVGYHRPDATPPILRYSAVLDDVTTVICRTYDGVTLPIDHPWLLSHWSPNHWGCRGVIIPAPPGAKITEDPPYTPPPMAGFGRAPFALFSQFRTRAA